MDYDLENDLRRINNIKARLEKHRKALDMELLNVPNKEEILRIAGEIFSMEDDLNTLECEVCYDGIFPWIT